MQTTQEGLSPLSRSGAVIAAVAVFTLAAAASSVRTAGAAAAVGPNADTTTTTTDKKKEDQLDEVVVTGSLIPQAKAETSTPVTIITAEQIEAKGFSTVADALQHASFSTGSVQGGGFSAGFTPGANTISLFGLNPGYTKFLIDGRPIADYPALYNGSDNFVSISGIPTILVEGVDILPGAQSSIYGSDAIAGVVNIRLKKQMDGPTIDGRYGWTTDGGGTNKRIGVADGFSFGSVNILVGGQYEKTDPIWGYKRSLTSQYVTNGTSPQVAERDWLVLGYYGQANGDLYYFDNLPGASCANVANQFNGTTTLQNRPGRGQYCGTTSAGYYTINNGSESTQGYLHVSDDLNDNTQLFADVLIDHDVVRFSAGGPFFSTSDDSTSPYAYYEDDRVTNQDYLNVQQIYSPEEMGGVNATMKKNTTNSIRMTAGLQGGFDLTNWKYDVDFTFTENRLTEDTPLAITSEINNFYSSIFGPVVGFDPNLGTNIYHPNYAQFFSPITPAQFESFTSTAVSRSRTEESLLRTQFTNSKLFALPGGEAGLAIVGEAGAQGWEYDPDQRYENGEAYLYTATAGSGHRARYALTSELKLPVVSMVTVDLSGRYDDYRVSGVTVDKGTYNLGVEFRPISSLLFRGRFGTAFKAPTLADEYQGKSGFFETLTDYYACDQHGYTGGPQYPGCPYAGTSLFGVTSGNTQLQPITAKVYDLGVAWSPLPHSSFTFDFIRWNINNEVQAQNADQLLKLDAECLEGTLDPTTPTCQNAINAVTRDSNGLVTQILTPKVNVAEEGLTVAVVGLDYSLPTSYAGTFIFDGSYSNLLRHTEIQFAGDTQLNLLENPFFSTDFKTKENLSATWNFHKFGTTLYVERYGRTPNNLATLTTEGYALPGAGRLGTWTLANLSAKYEVLPGLVVEANCDNIFNKMPPLDTTYSGLDNQPYNSLNYNPYGRSFFVQATYKYGK